MNAPARSSVFQDVASAIGRESARKLVEAFGGQRFFIPREFRRDHEIAKAIGVEAARQLASYYHGTWITLPVSGSRRRQVKALGTQPGMTRQKIAGETGYSERQVYRILGEEDDGLQGRLFDEGGEG